MLKFIKDDSVKFIDPDSSLVDILVADGWVLADNPQDEPKVKKAKNNG